MFPRDILHVGERRRSEATPTVRRHFPAIYISRCGTTLHCGAPRRNGKSRIRRPYSIATPTKSIHSSIRNQFYYRPDLHHPAAPARATMTYASTVTVTVDTICPWTYLARRRLSHALAEFRAAHPDAPATFTVRYAPYQLYPAAPAAGEDKRAWYAREKYADNEDTLRKYELVMGALGRDEGIDFRFGGTIANTLPAHSLVQWAQATYGPEVAEKVVECTYDSFAFRLDSTRAPVSLTGLDAQRSTRSTSSTRPTRRPTGRCSRPQRPRGSRTRTRRLSRKTTRMAGTRRRRYSCASRRATASTRSRSSSSRAAGATCRWLEPRRCASTSGRWSR